MSERQLERWYVIHARSGSEEKVVEAIKRAIVEAKILDIVELVIPTETVTEVKQGKKIATEKKFLSGYILMKAEMNEKLIHIITKTKDVSKFLGSKTSPTPISETEVSNIFEQMKNGTFANQKKILFSIGDSVKINDGPFGSFIGEVQGVDEEKTRLKVSVTIFGRAMPVDVSFSQVTKIIN